MWNCSQHFSCSRFTDQATYFARTNESPTQENCLEDNYQNDKEITEGSMQRRAWTECFLNRTQQLQN